ncbi:MAG: radical SAM protein [Deltaproteobacteria bacterium]|nr:radical SAM protein [Deltaproteobacteria bacterium]
MNEQIQLLIKSGTVCNLACAYCGDRVSGPEQRLQFPTLSKLASQLASLPQPRIVVAWHGGEPLTVGQNYFVQASEILKSYCGRHQSIYTCVHTNGLLLDESWMDIFKSLQVSVSVSIDGPKSFHDRYRHDVDGSGSFERAVIALRIASKSELGASVSTTVHDDTWEIASELLDLCRSLQINQLHFEPRLNRGSSRWIRPVSASAFSRFVTALKAASESESSYGLEIPTLGEWSTPGVGKPSTCVFCREQCFTNIAVDWTGDVFPCDLFHGNSSMCVGNIHTTSLMEIMSGDTYLSYQRAASVVPSACRSCQWAEICRGACPYQRYMTFGSFDHPSPYCGIIR